MEMHEQEQDPARTMPSADVVEEQRQELCHRYKHRNLVGFWLLGLCNNFAYVIMLSAAHDILSSQEHEADSASTNVTTTSSPAQNKRQCNPTSTGAILLADILPTLIIKLTAPWYLERVPFLLRVMVVVLFAAASFLIVSFSATIAMSFFGVICASISSGFGEPTFLSLTSRHHHDCVSTWSSGTGAAGLLGAVSYAGLTHLLSPRQTLLVMLVIPALLFLSYFFIIKTSPLPLSSSSSPPLPSPSDHQPLISDEIQTHKVPPTALTLRHKMRLVKPLIIFMVPLLIVYFAEYFINQGLTELLEFDLDWLTLPEQYRWYQADYQLGVFLSRSSVNIFPVKHIWILALLQTLNLILFLTESYYLYLPSIWLVLLLILYEGLLGGSAYVNTFYTLRKQTIEEEREFALTFASLADTTGICVAGLIALPVHNKICALPKP